jgi:hypothetical protein
MITSAPKKQGACLRSYCPVFFVGGVCHDENRIAAYAKLVEIVEEDIQSRLEKGEILPEPKNDI